MKVLNLIIVFFAMVLMSCSKNDSENEIDYFGRTCDVNLTGKWIMKYNTKDLHNSITEWIDTTDFDGNNRIKSRLYKFIELEEETIYQYYTENDSILHFYGKEEAKWKYEIKNDSLLMTSYFPCSSNIYCERRYMKDERIGNTP